MSRKTKAAEHLRAEEVREKIRLAKGTWQVRKWMIIWNGLIDPRPAKEIAKHVGVSVDTVHQTISNYNRFGPSALEGPGRGGRRNSYLSLEEERGFLEPFIEKAKIGQIATVAEIQQVFEERVGRAVVETTIYRLLDRHKWRKIVPRPRHRQASPEGQEAFKKTFHNRSTIYLPKETLKTEPCCDPGSR